MAIEQPISTDKQSHPDHSLSHRVFANDDAAAVKAVVVDSSNNILLGDGTTNYVKVTSGGELSLEGSAGFLLPYMMQSDTNDQAIVNAANAQVLTFNTSDHIDLITKTSTSRFTMQKEGSYLIVFSGIAQGVINEYIEVWLRVDGSDVANSNTRYQFKSNGATTVISVSFIYHFSVNQYFELWTWGSSTSDKWDYTAAGTNPTRPASPSIIMTCNYIGKD
jgi:hypothetical protein